MGIFDEEQEIGYNATRRQEGIDAAVAKGMILVPGTPTTLTLDIDNLESLKRLSDMKSMVHDMFGISEFETWPSKSGKGKQHVVVHLEKPLPVMTRIALQAILGSDPKRECLNAYSHQVLGIEEPCLLFKPPEGV